MRQLVLSFAFLQMLRWDAGADGRLFVESYCSDCHDAETREGQVQLDEITDFKSASPHLWAKIYEQVASGEMPPKKKKQPDAGEREQLLDWIVSQSADQISGQGATRRRLNRREFSAALQDLTGVPADFAAGLPEDGKTGGFDTGEEGLQDAADSVSQMLEVTRRAVESIRFLEVEKGQVLKADFRKHAFTDFRKWIDQNYKESGIFTKSKRLTCKEGIGLYLPTEWSGDRGSSFLALPAPADKRAAMRVRLQIAGRRPFPEIPMPVLWVKIGGKYIDYVPVLEEAQSLEYVVRMEDHLIEDGVIKIMLRPTVEMPYAVEGFENDDRSKPEDKIPGGFGVYRPKFDKKVLRDQDEQPVPSAVIETMEIDYDYKALWPPENWKSGAGAVSDRDGEARRLLQLWIDRAWRRPAGAKDADRFFALYRELRSGGLSFDDALRSTFQSVLMGGPFRYLASPADPDPAVAQYAIASRLSFMLAGAPPDAELRRLAGENKLRDPKVLSGQVDRLLDEPRSDAFFRPFVTQWLKMDQPVTLTMSHLKKQDFRFGRHLKDSMKEETIQYVRQLFVENRKAGELIDSDWTMMNDILAVHYERPPLRGAHLRKVRMTKTKDDPRGGGILGHAGIQSMLTWMGDNWVIYRGAWALDHILDDPPPPPPLEVPELNPFEGENRRKTFRELLAMHASDSRCSICHVKIDPMGFAFQNFDLSGRWRNVEHERYKRNEIDGKIEWYGEGETRPVDVSGQLPRGETFTSYAEFKDALREHYLDDVVRGLLKKLTLYGTGRTPNVLDLMEIREMMKEGKAGDYPVRDILKALVCSPVFLEPVTPAKK